MNTFYATVFHSVRKCLFLCLMAVCCASVQSWAVVRYVKLTPTGTANGSSWANASGNLQGIINASITGDEVWVAQGTYYPSADFFGNPSPADVRTKTFVMNQGVAIYGGFLGNETLRTQRNWMTNLTTLSGEIQQDNNVSNNCYHVILNSGNGLTSIAVLDGFTITGGNANGNPNFNRQGGGMYNDGNDSPSVINCTFSGNSASSAGGGMYNDQAPLTVTNCTFRSNSAGSGGGGMYNGECAPNVTRCAFLNNAATGTGTGGKGGGMWNNKGLPAINNCVFSGNSANNGGGIYVFQGTFFGISTISNCIFGSNSATQYGGGLFHESMGSANPSVRNCTFSSNSATNGGGGIYNYESSPAITNTILWGNGNEIFNDDVIIGAFPSNPSVTYSVVQGGYAGTGNLNVNPLFVNAADIDGADNIFRTADDGLNLNPCSPAINAGTNAGVTTDILGNARVSTTDVGAYEYQDSTAPTITASGPTTF